MSLPKLVDPRDTSGLDVSAFLSPAHRAHLDLLGDRYAMFRGVTMKKDEDEDEEEDDPLELDPEDRVKVGDKVMTVAQLQRIAATEKRQGKKAGQKSVLEQLGYDTVEDALEALSGLPKGDPKDKGGKAVAVDQADEEDRRQRRQREQAADERQRLKERKLDLRGALRDAGVSRADLDAGEALLDRLVDRDYDEDDVEDAIERLKEQRAGKALFDVEDDEEDPRKRVRAAGIPKGRPKGKPKPPAKPFGAAGRARAERKGWIKTDD